MQNKFFKKIITLCILISFVLPRPTYGQGFPVFDSQQLLATVKEYGLDSLATALLSVLATKISNKVFNKANGGASGDSSQSSFIQNYGDYFSNLALESLDKYVVDLGLSNNPYAADIARSLIRDAQGGGGLDSFNLDTVLGPQWRDFSTDVSVGGWDGFLALTNPANTALGSALIAQQQLADTIENKAALEQLKLIAPGTRPQGKCTLDFGEYKNQVQQIRDNRGLLNDIENSEFEEIYEDENGVTYLGEVGGSSDPNSTTSAVLEQAGGTLEGVETLVTNTQQSNQNISAGLTEEYSGCLQELISNPTGLVELGLNNALQAAGDKLTAGDELGEMIAGALIQMVNVFISSGLTALKAEFQSRKTPVGGPEQLVNQNGQSIPWTQAPNVIIDLSEEFQPAITTTEEEVDNLRAYLNKISDPNENNESFTTVITELDQCIPGPDYGFRKRLSAYVSKQTKRLDKRKDKGKESKTVVKNNVLDNIETSVDTAKTAIDLNISNASQNIPAAGVMLAEVATIDSIRDRYQDTKSELAKKQIALNLLYSIESNLQANIQTLGNSIPTLPNILPFTTGAWDRMSADQKTTALNWAKTISLNINTRTITAPDVPLTLGDWDALSAEKKTAVLTWAKTFAEQPAGTPDRNFVISVTTLLLGLPQNTSDAEVKGSFTINTVWNVWENPQNYMENVWEGNSPEAVAFLNQKNEIRGSFYALRNDISIPYTAEQAENELRQLEVIVTKANQLRDDCMMLRSVVDQNRLNTQDIEAHNKLNDILKQNIDLFKSQEMKEAIRVGGGILSQPPILSYTEIVNASIECDANACYDGSDLIPLEYGLAEDDEPELTEADRKNWTKFQIPIAKNIWELLDQGNQAFCPFNQFLYFYPGSLPNQTLDGGRSIECSPDWSQIDKISVRTIIFSTDVDDDFF